MAVFPVRFSIGGERFHAWLKSRSPEQLEHLIFEAVECCRLALHCAIESEQRFPIVKFEGGVEKAAIAAVSTTMMRSARAKMRHQSNLKKPADLSVGLSQAFDLSSAMIPVPLPEP